MTPAPRGGRQVIPRPGDWSPGASAPWAGLGESALSDIKLERVREVVTSGARIASVGRVPAPGTGAVRPARSDSAVLVALFEEHGQARVVLTRRAAHLRTHTGEVAFPGGRLDPGETPEVGALREASEEVGLAPEAAELVGRLSPLSTFSSSAAITPVVGLLESRPVLRPNRAEVERVFDASLAELCAKDVFREEVWRVGAEPAFSVWFFELDEDTVWGATARMLVELLRLVLGV